MNSVGLVEAAKILAGVNRIVVHAGLAHLDDMMAAAMAYAFGVRHDVLIERRNPTPAELDDLHTLVLDVGMVHDPSRLDFDHHQRGRDEEPKCSYRLFAEWLGVEEEMQLLYPWYKTWNLMDVCGPVVVAQSMGTTIGKISGLLGNPVSNWVIQHFADDPALRQRFTLSVARDLLLTRECWQGVQQKAVMRELAGFKVGDFTNCLAEEVSHASDVWASIHKPDCMMMRDSRGEGFSLLRCDNENPCLDFSQCVGRSDVLFAHPNGFILKTMTLEDDVADILNVARVR